MAASFMKEPLRSEFRKELIEYGNVVISQEWPLMAEGGWPPEGYELPDEDGVYLACGAAIVAGIATALYLGLTGRSIFWPEALAVVAFASSWLVKGYAPKKKMFQVRG